MAMSCLLATLRKYIKGKTCLKEYMAYFKVFRTVLISISVCTFRIAVCIDGPKRFAANARQLLGKEAIKQRHLEILGYEVVQVVSLPIHFLQIVLIFKIVAVNPVSFLTGYLYSVKNPVISSCIILLVSRMMKDVAVLVVKVYDYYFSIDSLL